MNRTISLSSVVSDDKRATGRYRKVTDVEKAREYGDQRFLVVSVVPDDDRVEVRAGTTLDIRNRR